MWLMVIKQFMHSFKYHSICFNCSFKRKSTSSRTFTQLRQTTLFMGPLMLQQALYVGPSERVLTVGLCFITSVIAKELETRRMWNYSILIVIDVPSMKCCKMNKSLFEILETCTKSGNPYYLVLFVNSTKPVTVLNQGPY